MSFSGKTDEETQIWPRQPLRQQLRLRRSIDVEVSTKLSQLSSEEDQSAVGDREEEESAWVTVLEERSGVKMR